MRLSLPLLLSTLATPALADPPRVVTDLPAVHSLAAQVMAGLGEPAILLDRGADPHNVQLRPSQARLLAEADLLFWIGPEMTPWLVRAIEGVGIRGEAISLLHAQGVHLQDFADDHGHGHHDDQDDHDTHAEHDRDHDHDHDHDHEDHGHDASQDHDHANEDYDRGHADEAHHDDHDHDAHGDHGQDDQGHSHDGTDPHAWLDPHNARVWVDLIAAELAERDPENAATYAANAAGTRDSIDALEAELRETIAPVGDAPIFVFHSAYGYFAGHFGLNVAGSIALGDAADPGAGRMTEIRALLADEGAVCIFPEVQHDMRYVDLVVEGTNVRVGAALDPSGSELAYGPDLYATMLRNLAQSIADCVAG
jgi:zinc transport system substrate-binding protein